MYCLLAFAVNKYCVYRNPFFVIYSFCYLSLDLIQIRNFFAFSILLPFLLALNKPGAKSLWTYLIGLATSFTFHFSMFFFSIFSVIGIKRKSTKIAVVSSILILIILLFPIFYTLLSASAAFEHAQLYDTPSFLGGAFMMSWQFCNYFLIKFVSKKYNRRPIILLQSNKDMVMKSHSITNKYINNLNLCLLLISPLVLLNGTVTRIFRYISLVNLMYLLNVLYNQKGRKSKYDILVIILIYSLFFAIEYIFSDPKVYSSIFNNFLFE